MPSRIDRRARPVAVPAAPVFSLLLAGSGRQVMDVDVAVPAAPVFSLLMRRAARGGGLPWPQDAITAGPARSGPGGGAGVRTNG